MPISNKLLAALPRKDYQRISARLEQVALEFGQILYEPGDTIRHIYFPNDALVSLLTLADGHLALEVGMVGCEGMVGAPMALGIGVSPVRALVQGTGTALRMTSAGFQKEFAQCLPLQRLLHRYVHVLMAQVTQTAACNRFHVVEKRLARWLLMTLDRVSENPFQLTPGISLTHAGRASSRRHQSRHCIAAAKTDQLQPRQYHRSRPCRPGGVFLRLLSGGERHLRAYPRMRLENNYSPILASTLR